MVWLYLDGVEIGPMNHHFLASVDQHTTSDWISGRDFAFSYIGMDSTPVTDWKLVYYLIQESAHVHSYTAITTAPGCTEQGYTTYTCACGESFVGDTVDAVGHGYENGVCLLCGAEHPNLEKLEGKVISILGDSISTFAGFIPTADLPDNSHPNAAGMDYISAAVTQALLEACQLEAGENIVHSVTYELSEAKCSLGYYCVFCT